MSRRLPIVVVGAALVLALTACSSSDDDGTTAADDTTTTTSTTTTEATTTDSTATTASTAPEPTRPTGFAPSAREAMTQLKDAWDAGDQDAARAIALGEVVDALFQVPAAGFEIYGCDTGEFDQSGCNYRNRGSGQFFAVTAQRYPEGWQVVSIFMG